MEYCVADSQETKKRAKNFTVDIVSIHLQEKQTGNENNEKDNCQVNTYNKSEANKITGENASKKKENASEQNETRATDTSR